MSALKDVASGEIVSYSLSKSLKLGFVLETIRKITNVFLKRNISIIHSDQGAHYRSKEYRALLKKYGIIQSMSRRGKCIDNAPIESFFGHMKDKIDYRKCKTFEDLKDLIDNYIYDYNNKRCQWNKKKMTPAEYRHYLLAS